jgi:2-oxoisovalerate dehydrogenase E1 component beta subunit
MPVVVRIPFGGGIGAVEHHSESPEALFAHVAGLKVVACSNPSDAYWMIQQAIASDDPVIFFEPKRRYWEKGAVDTDAEPGPLFASRVVRPGNAVTLATYGPLVTTCLEAATAAAGDDPARDLEVIDLRTLSPLDLGPVVESVRRTGHLVVVAEAPSETSVASEVAARVQEECFHSLEAPVLKVTGFDTPYPPAKCEDDYLPDLDRVLDAVDRSLAW